MLQVKTNFTLKYFNLCLGPAIIIHEQELRDKGYFETQQNDYKIWINLGFWETAHPPLS